MVSREDDRILYHHSVDEIEAGPRGPLAVGFGRARPRHRDCLHQLDHTRFRLQRRRVGVRESEPIAAARTGFDASPSEFKICDPTGQARPDFSIVVAGASAADGRQIGSRVVQFVVVDGIDDLRPERDVQAQTLCTLPQRDRCGLNAVAVRGADAGQDVLEDGNLHRARLATIGSDFERFHSGLGQAADKVTRPIHKVPELAAVGLDHTMCV